MVAPTRLRDQYYLRSRKWLRDWKLVSKLDIQGTKVVPKTYNDHNSEPYCRTKRDRGCCNVNEAKFVRETKTNPWTSLKLGTKAKCEARSAGQPRPLSESKRIVGPILPTIPSKIATNKADRENKDWRNRYLYKIKNDRGTHRDRRAQEDRDY